MTKEIVQRRLRRTQCDAYFMFESLYRLAGFPSTRDLSHRLAVICIVVVVCQRSRHLRQFFLLCVVIYWWFVHFGWFYLLFLRRIPTFQWSVPATNTVRALMNPKNLGFHPKSMRVNYPFAFSTHLYLRTAVEYQRDSPDTCCWSSFVGRAFVGEFLGVA